MDQENFYMQVQKALSRATDAEWREIRKELEGHVKDRAAVVYLGRYLLYGG